MILRPMEPDDWPEVNRIYSQGIQTGLATFETEVPSWETWDSAHLKNLRTVVLASKEIIGWIALSAVSGRCVYGGVAEVSVYIAESFRGRGAGLKLLDFCISQSENHGLWTLQAGIFPENVASIKLHEKAGFRIIGYREKIGMLQGVWRDTVLLERRSKLVGL